MGRKVSQAKALGPMRPESRKPNLSEIPTYLSGDWINIHQSGGSSQQKDVKGQ